MFFVRPTTADLRPGQVHLQRIEHGERDLVRAATQATASDEERPRLNGAWNVAVTIKSCETGELIRSVRAVNLYVRDGTMAETSSNSRRSSSLGTWRHLRNNTYTAMFEFFRYNPDGSFATWARVRRTIEVSEDGTQFVSTGRVAPPSPGREVVAGAV